MMTARQGVMEGALLGGVLTVARGDSWMTIPAREISDLIALLRELESAQDIYGARPLLSSVEKPKVSVISVAQPDETPSATKRVRRGRVWEAVRAHLNAAGRAQGFPTLLKMVKEKQLTDRNPEHALRICLGKKVAAGELRVTRSGRYSVANIVPSKGSARSKDVQPVPKHRKHRPGELWQHMKAHLSQNPKGLTFDQLISAAEAGQWTSAKSPTHAVKICVSRVGDQVERLADGRVRLAVGPAEPQEAKTSGVRRRRKRATAKKSRVPKAEETPGPAPSMDDPAFDASAHYPTPRSRQPT